MNTIKHIVNNFLCTMFGHKESRTIMAYHIDTYSMSLSVEIYIVSFCSRCGWISVHLIDKYERCSWCASQLTKTAEDILRKQGLITTAEAYKKLLDYKNEWRLKE